MPEPTRGIGREISVIFEDAARIDYLVELHKEAALAYDCVEREFRVGRCRPHWIDERIGKRAPSQIAKWNRQ